MSYYDLVSCYTQCCLNGEATFGECGPLWQLGLISTFLLASLVTLLIAYFSRVNSSSTRKSY
jgi:hypothetical protein